MTQQAFARYFGIPKRSIENWEGGKRECPAYLLDLISYKLEHESLQPPMTVTQALLLFAEHAPYHTEQCLELIRHIELGDKEIFGRKGVQYIAAHLDEYLDFPVEVQQPLRQVIDRWMAEHPAT